VVRLVGEDYTRPVRLIEAHFRAGPVSTTPVPDQSHDAAQIRRDLTICKKARLQRAEIFALPIYELAPNELTPGVERRINPV